MWDTLDLILSFTGSEQIRSPVSVFIRVHPWLKIIRNPPGTPNFSST
jgi:hypothetical protein